MEAERTTPDKLRKLLELLRDYSRLQAEVQSLAAILKYVEDQGCLPSDGWLASLKAMRETPQYRSIAEQHEPLFLRAEQSLDVNEVEHLLETMPLTRTVH
jgi:hypothetical protein